MARTGKLADVLEVERELSRAVTELEQMKGERRYYDRQVAVSSIAVDVYELGQIASGGIAEPVTEAPHRSLGLLATSASMLIYAVVFLAPWAVLLAAAWWLGARYFREQGGGWRVEGRFVALRATELHETLHQCC